MKLRRNKIEGSESGAPGQEEQVIAMDDESAAPEPAPEPEQTPDVAADGFSSSSEVQELLGAEREARELLERRRASLRSAVVAEGERKLADAQAAFDQDRDQLESQMAATRAQAEESAAAMRATQEQLGRELEQERTQNVELQSQVEDLSSSLNDTQDSLDQIKGELATVRGDLTEERERGRTNAQQSESQLAELRSQGEERTAAIRESHEQASLDLERERTRRSDLQEQLEHESTERQRAQEGLEQTSAELEEVRAKADAAERKAVDIRAQAETWVKEVRARVETAESELAEARAQAQERVAAVREDHEHLVLGLERERTRSGDLETRLEEAALAGDKARAERDQAAAERDKTRAALEGEREKHREHLAATEERHKSVRTRADERVTAVRQSHEELGLEIESERTRTSELEAQLARESQALEQALAEADNANALLADARIRADAETRQREELAQRLQAVVELEADARESREQRLQELEDSLAQAEGSAREAWRQVEAGGGGSGEEPGNGAVSSRANGAETPEAAEVRGRRARRRVAPAEDVSGACSICQVTPPSSDPAELGRQGWMTQGDIVLCSDCQTEGWQLPDGATAPVRRLSDRQG